MSSSLAWFGCSKTLRGLAQLRASLAYTEPSSPLDLPASAKTRSHVSSFPMEESTRLAQPPPGSHVALRPVGDPRPRPPAVSNRLLLSAGTGSAIPRCVVSAPQINVLSESPCGRGSTVAANLAGFGRRRASGSSVVDIGDNPSLRRPQDERRPHRAGRVLTLEDDVRHAGPPHRCRDTHRAERTRSGDPARRCRWAEPQRDRRTHRHSRGRAVPLHRLGLGGDPASAQRRHDARGIRAPRKPSRQPIRHR